MNDYTYEEALAIAKVAGDLKRHDVPCPGGAAEKLLERIRNLEERTSEDAYVQGFMDARDYFGGGDESEGTTHGAECANRDDRGYICNCDEEGIRTLAREWARG